MDRQIAVWRKTLPQLRADESGFCGCNRQDLQTHDIIMTSRGDAALVGNISLPVDIAIQAKMMHVSMKDYGDY
jgi:hypothetical protein